MLSECPASVLARLLHKVYPFSEAELFSQLSDGVLEFVANSSSEEVVRLDHEQTGEDILFVSLVLVHDGYARSKGLSFETYFLECSEYTFSPGRRSSDKTIHFSEYFNNDVVVLSWNTTGGVVLQTNVRVFVLSNLAQRLN